MRAKDHIVIVGGGFGGLYAALSLRKAPLRITLIDRRNFHLFQPLLYQVATGGLSPADIASPLRGILKRQKNVRVLQGEVRDIDTQRRQVLIDGQRLGYDALILAAGARHHYFGHDSWERSAPGLKTIEDALSIRGRVLSAFERAELASDRGGSQPLRFVVIGGGPTGVELAGAIGELARYTLRENFRAIDPARAEVLLIEAADRVLPGYPPQLSARAAASLGKLGVSILTRTQVQELNDPEVSIVRDGKPETLRADAILWAAGVQASPLGAALARSPGVAVDRQGRVIVEGDLSLPGHPEVFVIGDMAHAPGGADGRPLPGVAPVAIQQGRYVARLLLRRLRGRQTKPFRYRDRGALAVIGRAEAVGDLGKVQAHGFLAWLIWLFIHLINLVEFENRLLVLVQWGWNYFTRNRSARLITEQSPTGLRAPPHTEPETSAGETRPSPEARPLRPDAPDPSEARSPQDPIRPQEVEPEPSRLST